MKVTKTFNVDIFIGTCSDLLVNEITINAYYDFMHKFCDEKGCCFSVQRTQYVYTDGSELGLKITLINYPRFPKTQRELINIALYVAQQLQKIGRQKRVSVATPANTYMLESDDEEIKL